MSASVHRPPLEAGRFLDSLRSSEPPPIDLLNRAASLSKDVEWRSACLRTAATNDQHEAILSLMEQGFDPMIDGGLSLVLAAGRNHHRCVEALLRAGVPPRVREDEAFLCAAASGAVLSLETLIAFSDPFGFNVLYPALLAALGAGRVKTVERLLRQFPTLPDAAWPEVVRNALTPQGAASVALFERLRAAGCTNQVMSRYALPAAAWNGDRPVVAWMIGLELDLTADHYAAICCAANSESMPCFTLVCDAMHARGELTDATFVVMRSKGLEAYATMAQLFIEMPLDLSASRH